MEGAYFKAGHTGEKGQYRERGVVGALLSNWKGCATHEKLPFTESVCQGLV